MKGELLTPEMLLHGYSCGAFPMTVESGDVEWFRPTRRALFPLSGMRVSRSLHKVIRRGVFEIRFDTAFEQVMLGCFRPVDNWLSEHFVRAYCDAHRQGWAHSAECWQGDDLVGGVYGLALGACLCAESMFHRTTDASKVALWALIERCRDLGFTLFDAQLMNPHLRSLGAYEVPDSEYMAMLERALVHTTPWSAVQTKHF